MLNACLKKIPKDLFISVAAVTDWKVSYNKHKLKKYEDTPKLKLLNNPDIQQYFPSKKDLVQYLVLLQKQGN